MFPRFLHVVLFAKWIFPIAASRAATNGDADVFSCDVIISFLHSNGTLQDMAAPNANEDISCLVNDLVYSIPESIIEAHKEQLKASGRKTMHIVGGSLPGRGRAGAAASDEIVVPSASKIEFRKSGDGLRRLSGSGLQRKQGTSEVLVIRVIANDARSSMSANLLYDRVFGDGSKVIQDRDRSISSGTLTKTYMDCSHGKLNIVPAKGDGIVKGVGFVKINMNVTGATNRKVENAVTTAIEAKYGSVGKWDHIMYCLPKGTVGPLGPWYAYGYNDYYRSVYNDEWCGQNSVVVHEIGHNIGLQYVLI